MQTAVNRWDSLDYLRGYAALSILLYHYFSWSETHGLFDFFLGKLGYYGVEFFYFLSGVTLALVYSNSGLHNARSIKRFYVKRIFRIFPLLWLVTILTIILNKEIPSLEVLIINFSGLFSVYKIDSYIAKGAWSIGNELFFYLLFPFLIAVRKKSYVLLLSTLIVGFYLYFLLPESTLSSGSLVWKNYINPLNHLFFFYSGILFYRYRMYLKKIPGSKLWWLVFFLPMILIPYDYRPQTVIGLERILYSCLVLVAGILSIKASRFKSEFWHSISEHLGKVSYSLYLTHPLVWGIFGYLRNQFGLQDQFYIWVQIPICIIFSLCISSITYKYFELNFLKLGKKVAMKI